ncbi:MAG: hypothetical protein ACI8TE_000658 [Francisella sp.]
MLGADITAINIISMSYRAQKKGVIKAFVLYVFAIVALLSIFYIVVAIIGFWVAKDVLFLKEIYPVFVVV